MITPRRTRLLRVPSLRGLHDVLVGSIAELDAISAADTFVLVPTRAAAEQLRRTVEDRAGASRPVLWWPHCGTRADLYRELGDRLLEPPASLSAFDREILLGRLAREAAGRGLVPPFALRPAIVAEMLALYDHIRWQARSVDDFDRNLRAELEPAADSDRGAAQLLQQTAFLSAVFDAYERHLNAHALSDEHRLRAQLLAGDAARPLRRIIVAVGDRVADPDGVWPSDFTLLSALPDLAALDLIATEALLAAGLLERVHAAWPGLEEVPDASAAFRGATVSFPRLVVPAADVHVFTTRDREDELAAVARRIKHARTERDPTPLARHALVVRRPLPYLYLARAVFGSAGIPFETLDTLPLAAEPYAAALDLVLDAVGSGYTRSALLALLRSPHFTFETLAPAFDNETIGALDRALADARYLGGIDRLEALAASWVAATAEENAERRRRRRAQPAMQAALAIARSLGALAESRPVLAQIDTLRAFLDRHVQVPHDELEPDRHARVRRAVLGAIDALSRAYASCDPDLTVSGTELAATIRRWLGAQTFATRTGVPGVRILDAQAARFADVDDVQVLGLIEGEWPEPVRRSIFYPPFLLGLLDPAPAADDPNRRESQAMAAARASFGDLLGLAHARVRASTFALDADAVVEPSPLADDLGTLGFTVELQPMGSPVAVFAEEALLAEPPVLDSIPPIARAWSGLRGLAPRPGDRRYLGEAGPWQLPRVSVSRIDRYLKCPFQFFASEVLGLEEEPDDAAWPPPWERGRFLHGIFESFFREWQDRGHGRISPALVPAARALLVEICEQALSALPEHEATLERPRLYGSAVSAGIIDRVLTMEAERPAAIERRLMEFALDDEFAFRSPSGDERRHVRLRAKVDRVDLLAGGAFRIIDYKTKIVPDVKRSVQLQVYTAAVAERLRRSGDPRQPAEAFYLSLEGDDVVKPLRPARDQTLDDVVKDGEQRMLQAIDDMEAGHFPARPTPRSLCGQCPFDTVCRKAFVELADD